MATTKRDILKCTNKATIHLPEKAITPHGEKHDFELSEPLPLCHHMDLILNNDWALTTDPDHFILSPHEISERHHCRAEFNKAVHEYRTNIRHAVYSVETTTQLQNNFPGLARLPVVQNAIEHEKQVREAAKLKKKTAAPLEVIEVKDTNAAIAKARLLGAKYVT